MADQYAPLVQDRQVLNEVKYAARDFPSIFDALLRRLKQEYGDVYNDYATTAVGIMLTDMAAYAAWMLQWYLDRRASDCYLDTARTHEAVAPLTRQIGYKLGPAASSSGILKLTFPDGVPAAHTMKAGWQYEGPDGLVYESYADLALPPGGVPLGTPFDVNVDVRQGETRLLTYTADGTKNQSYRLTNVSEGRYVADQSVRAWVDGGEWTENAFLTFETTDQFEVAYLDAPPIVQFGDGIAGNIPFDGAEVKIRFVVMDGEKGNVKANTIQTSLDTLVIGGNEITLTVTNPLDTKGGTNPEDLDRARNLAPFAFAARGAAITGPDYQSLAGAFVSPTYGRVAKAYAYNPRASFEDIIFNGLIDDVEALLAAYRSTVDTMEQDLVTAADALLPVLTQIQTDLANLETVRTDMLSGAQAIEAQVEGASSASQTAQAEAGKAYDESGDLDSAIYALQGYVALSGIPLGVRTYINDELESIRSDLEQIKNHSLEAKTKAGESVAATGIALATYMPDLLYNLDETPANPLSFTMPSLLADMTTQVSTMDDLISDPATGIVAIISGISGMAEVLEGNIETVLAQMHTRIGELYSENCLSNHVQVPILSLDLEGNYVAPSSGLMIALQTYLDRIKEVTQTIEVIDGSAVLVPAEIEVSLRVGEGYVPAEVIAVVEATILGLLKGRDFDQPLYLSQIYDAVVESSAGVAYANVEIVGPILIPPVIDGEGNLVPAPNQIISYGSLTITEV